MTTNSPPPDDTPEPSLPPALIDALKRVELPLPPIPAGHDRALRAAAEQHLADRRFVRPFRWLAGVAVAASIGMLVLFSYRFSHSPARPGAGRATPFDGGAASIALHEDVDGDGRVDILDAFILAKKIEKTRGGKRAWDVNGDRMIDHADVDTVAQAAVRIDRSAARIDGGAS